MSKFLVVAYATHGPYEKESERLLASLRKIKDLHYQVDYVASVGTWVRNTNIKPRFIRCALKQNTAPVLYVDADAEIMRDPTEYVEDLIERCDVAACHRGKELLSGTLFFNYTPAALALLDDWVWESNTKPEVWDQKNLQSVIERKNDIKFEEMPTSYCYINDGRLMAPVQDPAILHHQASRRLKNVHN